MERRKYKYKVSDPVTTVCYGEEKVWESRGDARCFFLEALLNSEGSERDRYSKLLGDILKGLPRCTDTWDSDLKKSEFH